MARQVARRGSRQKEVRAWGIRRRQVDINQLALAYYLLARIRLEQQRESDVLVPNDTPAIPEALDNGRSSEAA